MSNREIYDAIGLWQAVMEKEGYRIRTCRGFATDAKHSGLLRYILDGNKPHPIPPPKCMSRPWHSLIDDGCAKFVGEVTTAFGEGRLVVTHDRWRIVDTYGKEGAEDWTVRYGWHDEAADHGLWRLTRIGDGVGGFREWILWRTDSD